LQQNDQQVSQPHRFYKKTTGTSHVEAALLLYLVLMVRNCSGERSFSKLKFIKTRLHTTMTQERLNDLALVSIARDILAATSLTIEDAINYFSIVKAGNDFFEHYVIPSQCLAVCVQISIILLVPRMGIVRGWPRGPCRPQFLSHLVIVCLEKRCHKPNLVACLK